MHERDREMVVGCGLGLLGGIVFRGLYWFFACLALLAIAAPLAEACDRCGHHGAACHYAPKYSAPYRAPEHQFFHSPTYPGYFIRGVWNAVYSRWDYESQIYVGKYDVRHGTWSYHPHSFQQRGDTVWGGSRHQNLLGVYLGHAPAVHVKPGVLKQLNDNAPPNAKDFLPDPRDQQEANVESANKVAITALEQKGNTDRAAIERDKTERVAQIQAAERVAKGQQIERIMRLQAEQLAIAFNNTNVSSSGDTGAQDIPIADQQVRVAISRNCFKCHGGEKVDGGVDFRLPLSRDVEDECKDQILTGEMPKEGQLSPQDKDTLVAYFRGRSKAARITK